MNIPGMMGRGGMMGGQPQGPAGDTPQVDTAENVQISSLALLKMLKHGAFRAASGPRADPRDSRYRVRARPVSQPTRSHPSGGSRETLARQIAPPLQFPFLNRSRGHPSLRSV